MPATTLRILHISDILFRSRNGNDDRAEAIRRETPRRARVLGGGAWQQNVQDLLADGPIDLVCMTGDTADWGKPEEFDQGTQFIKSLLSSLQLPKSRLFVVPGNHDIDRSDHDDARQGIRDQHWTMREAVSDWMAGAKPPVGVTDAWREQVLERQAAYRTWVARELDRPELLPESYPHRRLGYRIDIGPALNLPNSVWIIGLDTAWLAGDKHDAGKLLLTKDQLMLLGTREHGDPLPGLRIALGHHPLAELADGGEARNLLADYADLYLHGHQHQPITTLSIDPDHHLLEVAAGCLFEGDRGDEHPNGFQVISLALDEHGRPQQAELRFRSWSPRGAHWHDDSSIYRNAKNGRLPLTWPGADASPAASSSLPASPAPAKQRPRQAHRRGPHQDPRAWRPGMTEPKWVRALRHRLDSLRLNEVKAVDPAAKYKVSEDIAAVEAKLATWRPLDASSHAAVGRGKRSRKSRRRDNSGRHNSTPIALQTQEDGQARSGLPSPKTVALLAMGILALTVLIVTLLARDKKAHETRREREQLIASVETALAGKNHANGSVCGANPDREDFAEAKILLKQLDLLPAGEEDPSNHRTARLWGVYHYKRKELDAAIHRFEEATLHMDCPWSWYGLGMALGDAGRLDEAIEAFEKATDFGLEPATKFYALGLAFTEAERHEEAVEAYTRALELDPMYAEVYSALASEAGRRGEQEEATHLWEKALDIEPNNPTWRNGLGRSLVEADPDRAVRIFQAMKEDFPHDSAPYAGLGIAYEHKGDTENASENYHAAEDRGAWSCGKQVDLLGPRSGGAGH